MNKQEAIKRVEQKGEGERMKINNFYEVDGCEWFIPVTIDAIYNGRVFVTVSNEKRDYKLIVEEVHRFPKVHEQQIELLKSLGLEEITDE